jgi:hypothetical protein
VRAVALQVASALDIASEVLMAKYHINPDSGEASACKATKGKCPFGGAEEHYASLDKAREAFEKANETFARNAPTTLSEAAQAALSAELTWSGTTPKWLGETAKKQKELFGTEPKILAVIPSPLGELAVVWENDSVDSSDIGVERERGYEVNRITFNHLKTGEKVGYLKMGSMNEASHARSFGDDEWADFAWAEDALGGSYGFSNWERRPNGEYVDLPDVRNMTGDEKLAAKKKIWASSFAAIKVSPPDFDSSQLPWGSLVNLKPEHAPQDEAKLDKDLTVVRKNLHKQALTMLSYHAEPSIDYIQVDDRLRGKGMGHALYIFGARMQADKGRVLRASGIQTDQAKKSWKLMKKLGLPIRTMTKKTGSARQPTSEYFVLDFRKDSPKE